MTEPIEVDVVVLGMGAGGEDVAGKLAEAGLVVVGIERELVGGECPYWGCIPSKMMIRAANLLAEARRVPGMAGRTEVIPDYAPVARRIREEATDTWDDTVAVDRFAGKGGRFVRGAGRLSGPGRVAVGDQQHQQVRRDRHVAGLDRLVLPLYRRSPIRRCLRNIHLGSCSRVRRSSTCKLVGAQRRQDAEVSYGSCIWWIAGLPIRLRSAEVLGSAIRVLLPVRRWHPD